MSDRDKNHEMNEIEDERVNAALKNFRASVHAWSEQEANRVRTVRRAPLGGFWRVMATPMMGWALAGVLIVSGVGVPVTVNHHRQVAAAERAAAENRQRLATEAAARKAELAMDTHAMDDEELMNHVDSDVAQATPDAMEPLASMMSDTANK
jgi:hypothetical protein